MKHKKQTQSYKYNSSERRIARTIAALNSRNKRIYETYQNNEVKIIFLKQQLNGKYGGR